MEKIEIRAQEVSLTSDGDLKVSGYVNMTEQLSLPLGGAKKFREKIAKGAFTRAIENAKRDIDFLMGHDSKSILASTRNGSLTLREDESGLFMEAQITDTTFGSDTFKLIKSGILKNMSFGFRALKQSWSQVNGEAVRTVSEMELVEVSVVRDPAYSQSTIAARGLDVIEEVNVPSLEQLSNKLSEISENKEKRSMIKMTETHENDFTAIFTGETRTLQTTANGAELIPENVAGEIVKKMAEVSNVFARARKLNSVSGSLKVAKENSTAVAGFVGEGSDVLDQAIGFDEVKLEQKRVGAAITLSNQLINDSGVDLEKYTTDLLSRRAAAAVEKSILVGSTADEFRGIVGDADVAHVDVTGSAAIEDLLDLYLAIHPEFLQNAVFVMNRTFFNTIAKIKDTAGHFYVQNGVINGRIGYTLFGQPVEVTEVLPSTTPAIFGNITEAYTVLVKKEQGITVVAADTTQALRGSKLFVLDAHMDGAITNPQAVVKLNVTPAG